MARPAVQVPSGTEGLQALALQGRWREVAQRCRSVTVTATAAALSVAAFHVLALIKLKMNEDAAAELAKLGSWDDPANLASKAQGGAPLVPFALRVMRAELPWRLGRQQESVDRLYTLLEWCAGKQAAPPSAAGDAAATSEGQQQAGSGSQQLRWRHRRRTVTLQLVNKHCRLRQYKAALLLLDQLLQQEAGDVEAWTEAGMVQLMLGDLAAAQHTLRHAEQLLLSGGGTTTSSCGLGGQQGQQLDQQQRQLLIHRNRGLLCFVQHDYAGAVREYAAAVSLDPADPTAVNNHALALMYGCSLPQAVQALEQAFTQTPAAMMQEAVVTNLATMYELGASGASLDAKRHMAAWVAAAAPDDFELACTKTVGA